MIAFAYSTPCSPVIVQLIDLDAVAAGKLENGF
jgi:hypothetical protein